MPARFPKARIPDYVEIWDAAIVPFLNNAVTGAADAIELYECFSAGLPAIGTPLRQAKRFRGRVYVPADPAEFSSCIGEALAERCGAKRERRLAVARPETWASHAESGLDLIGRGRPAESGITPGA